MNAKSSFIYPQQALAPGVHVVSTCRAGGVSKNQYASLNLGLHCGDVIEDVLINRSLLADHLSLPTEPYWLSQVHGTNIIQKGSVDEEHNQAQPLNENADGIYTYSAGTVCAIMTADCLPLMLCDKNAKQIMAIHAGWRGVASGIVEKAVALFDCSASDIRAWAGPCIGASAFEVGPEVVKQLGGSENAYRPSENGEGRQYVNLLALVAERLGQQGVLHFSSVDECTYSDEQRFFSYRRDGQTGRMATLIWKEV